MGLSSEGSLFQTKNNEFKLTENSLRVLYARYLKKDKDGKVCETPEELFRRVARTASLSERLYADIKDEELQMIEDQFYRMMGECYFQPNSPTLMNAGREMGMLSACFVLPVEDSIEGIFDSIKSTALIQKAGGGTGFSFSRLRPKGDRVKSSGGTTSGPMSFLKVFSGATEAIQQGAFRRGANMGVMSVTHPDIIDFIEAKRDLTRFTNYNLSVAITDAFMEQLRQDPNSPHIVINPRNQESFPLKRDKNGVWSVGDIWNLILERAWESGEPGILFMDRINQYNPTPHIGEMEATNPCVTADTFVMTSQGPRQVSDLIGIQTEVLVNGEPHKTTEEGFFSTGKKEVYRLVTKEGCSIRLTRDHKVLRVAKITRDVVEYEWVEAGKLSSGDKLSLNNHRTFSGWKNANTQNNPTEKEGYLIGLLMGDGTLKKEKAVLSVWAKEETSGARGIMDATLSYAELMPHRKDFKGWTPVQGRDEFRMSLKHIHKEALELGLKPRHKKITANIEKTSSDFYRGFLRGFFDADGSIQGDQNKGVSIRLSQSDLPVLESVQRMLLRLGINSTLYKNRRVEGYKNLPDGQGSQKAYFTKANHELVISKDNILLFAEIIGFHDYEKQEKLNTLIHSYTRSLNRERFLTTFEKLVFEGEEEVFDVQVPGVHAFDANGFVAHNCGEQPLLPYEACNLGSINLGKFVEDRDGKPFFNYHDMREVVRLSTRFLDNIIDANNYPLPQIREVCTRNRKIGLGVMGFADALFKLHIPYNSEEGINFGEKIMEFVQKESHQMSEELSQERGVFPNWKGSRWEKEWKRPMRNACVTTVAPTGTISIIANCSGGIEPMFSLAFYRNVLDGQRFPEVNDVFADVAKEKGFYSEELINRIAEEGSIQHIGEIPEEIRHVFVTARDIHPKWHLRMQAAFQKNCDSSISKTINFDHSASKEDIKSIYDMAYDLRLKGVTIYRDGSRQNQPMALDKKKEESTENLPKVQEAVVPTNLTVKPIKLPEIMSGFRIRQMTPFGNMHIKVSVDMKDSREREVFAQLGKGGDVANSDLEAICRLLSLFLRCNGALETALHQLDGIGSSLSVPSKEGRIQSLADGLAKGIQKYLKAKKMFGLENLLLGKADLSLLEDQPAEKSKAHKFDENVFKVKCPECASNLTFAEGCMVCHGCGFSKC